MINLIFCEGNVVGGKDFPETFQSVLCGIVTDVTGDAANVSVAKAQQIFSDQLSSKAMIGGNIIVENIMNGAVENGVGDGTGL